MWPWLTGTYITYTWTNWQTDWLAHEYTEQQKFNGKEDYSEFLEERLLIDLNLTSGEMTQFLVKKGIMGTPLNYAIQSLLIASK